MPRTEQLYSEGEILMHYGYSYNKEAWAAARLLHLTWLVVYPEP